MSFVPFFVVLGIYWPQLWAAWFEKQDPQLAVKVVFLYLYLLRAWSYNSVTVNLLCAWLEGELVLCESCSDHKL